MYDVRVSRFTFVLQAALPVGLALGLAVTLQALVLQQSFLSLQLPQSGLQILPAAHLKHVTQHFIQHVLQGCYYKAPISYFALGQMLPENQIEDGH